MRAELELFDVLPNSHYLFLFSRPDTHGFGGSPKAASMTLNVDPTQLSVSGDRLLHLVAHEFFHTWGSSRAPLPGELQWLNEGITDYYAHVVPLLLGQRDPAWWHAAFAEKLELFERNPRRPTTPLTGAGGEAFFSDPHCYEMAYAGGLAVGAWLNAALQARGEADLVDVLRHFWNDPRWDDRGARPTLDDFLDSVELHGGEELRQRTRELVTKPLTLDLVELFAEAGVELERSLEPAPKSPRANFEGTTLTLLDTRGAGARVGLRMGDRLLVVNGREVASAGDIQRAWAEPLEGELIVEVERDGETLELRMEVQPIPPLPRAARRLGRRLSPPRGLCSRRWPPPPHRPTGGSCAWRCRWSSPSGSARPSSGSTRSTPPPSGVWATPRSPPSA